MDGGKANSTRAFLDALPAEHPLQHAADGELDSTLDKVVSEIDTAYPTVPIDASDVLQFLANSGAASVTVVEDLLMLRLADLKLAAGCERNNDIALAIVESELLPQVRAALSRLDKTGGDQTEEVLQIVREKLFVEKRVARYQGSGALGAFIQVTATREALMHLRSRRREVALSDAHLLSLAQVDSDPVLEYVRENYRAEVEAVLENTLSSLEVRDRALLRYAFVHKLSTAQIGVIYGVHRATVFRWLRSAREQLLKRVRLELADSLNIDTKDIESAIRLVRSRIELTLERVLESNVEG